MSIQVYTIGFAQTGAKQFFGEIRRHNIKKLVDVRLNNTSQLAGFTKKEDLRFFLEELCNIQYAHLPELAPTQQLLDGFKKQKGAWETYESSFLQLMKAREIEKKLHPLELADSCLLCSEKRPHYCHRRLVIEYLQQAWDENISVTHL